MRLHQRPVICPETAEVMVKAVQQMNLFEEKLFSVQNRSRYRIIGQVLRYLADPVRG